MSIFEKLLLSSFSQQMLYSAIFLVSAIFFINFMKRRNKFRPLEKIPGPPGNFLLGSAIDTYVDHKELFKLLVGKFCDYGDSISKIWLFISPYIFIHKAEGAEAILTSQSHITKADDYGFLLPWLRTGLLTSTGQKWHKRRKMLTPTFHFKILEDFIKVFNSKAEKLGDIFEKHDRGDYFDAFDLVTNCTLDVILETAMGTSINIQDNPHMDYKKAVHTMSYLVQKRTANPHLRSDLVYKILGYKKMEDQAIKVLHDFSTSAIQKRREMRKENKSSEEEGKKKRLAFLDLLLEKAEEDYSITDIDIQEEVDTFVFEGHDTTAAGITFSLFLLGQHPQIQRKVQEELESIFGDSNRSPTVDDLREMKYLECCIKEALRIFPSVPFIGRKLYDPIVIDGQTIPAGTSLFVIVFRIHRDPKHFPDPEEYIPERFLPENSAGRHPFAYIPFSAGPRNCIGQKFALMEEKAVISAILRRFNIESSKHAKEVQLLGQLILRPEKGIMIRVTSRK